MNRVLLVICLVGITLCPNPVFPECERPEYKVDLEDGWCCPGHFSQLFCWEALGKPGGKESCYSLGCFPEYLERIKRERKESRKQKPSDCKQCQEYLLGKCKNCNEVGLYCLDGNCIGKEEYLRISKQRLRDFIDKKRDALIAANQAKNQAKQNEFDKEQEKITSPSSNPDHLLPPPDKYQHLPDNTNGSNLEDSVRRNNERAKICMDRKVAFLAQNRNKTWTQKTWEDWWHICDGLNGL